MRIILRFAVRLLSLRGGLTQGTLPAYKYSTSCFNRLDLPAIAPGDVLRLARGCPRLTSLDYSLDPVDSDDEPGSRLTDSGLSVADQSHIADLFDLLESRCREANMPPRFQIKLLV